MQYTTKFYREADAATQIISFFFVFVWRHIELERKILMTSLTILRLQLFTVYTVNSFQQHH